MKPAAARPRWTESSTAGWAARLAQRAAERAAAGLRRRLLAAERQAPGRIRIDGVERIDFGSNDYLGLAHDPRLAEHLAAAARRHGLGAGAARLLGGHGHAHAELEEALAEWLGAERVLLFSTGYHAALGVLGALLERGDVAVQDKLNHACLLDGARLAGAELRRYPHLDLDGAERQLARPTPGLRLLVTESVFGMDGDRAPLAELRALANRHAAWLLVDEAHALGVLGPDGAGAAAGLDVPIRMATLGKALGSFGALIAGDRALIEHLIDHARTFVYTTALPPAWAEATRHAVVLARTESWRRRHLEDLIERFRDGARALELPLAPSSTAIQPLLVGSARAALSLAERLRAAGFHVPAIRPPTVPPGTARLRINLSAAHAETDVDALLAALAAAWSDALRLR